MKKRNMKKSILAGVVSTAMLATALTSGALCEKTEVYVRNTSRENICARVSVTPQQVRGVSGSAVATQPAADIAKRAVASYAFADASEIKNMNSAQNTSGIQEVSGCGSVLVLGNPLKAKSYGVELENPYAGKEEFYSESLEESLANNGVVYNGTAADEITMTDEQGNEFQGLDTTVMPMVGRTYPYPEYRKGISISAWVKVPENTTENGTFVLFRRRVRGKGIGGLSVHMDGTVQFYAGDQGVESKQNCYVAYHNLEKLDPLSKAGEWIFLTVTVKNDEIKMYFNGVEAEKKVDPTFENGTTRRKYFNRGFGYKDEKFRQENPAEFYKNYRDILSSFSAEDRANGNFTDFGTYRFLNSTGETIMDILSHADAQLYLGGDNAGAIWGNGIYKESVAGVMIDDMNLFGEVLSDADVKALYEQSVQAGDTEEPESSVQPSESLHPQPSETTGATQQPSGSESAASKNPQQSEAPSSETPAQFHKGDADGNGKVELADAQLVLKAALKILSLKDEAVTAADVDGNGKIELADAQKILKVALKIETF